MQKQEKLDYIVSSLTEQYKGTNTTFLSYSSDYTLLVAIILSARCSDKQVNKVTKKLFQNYCEPHSMAYEKYDTIAKEISSLGLYHSKARYIVNTSRKIHEQFNGKVPQRIEDLMTLDGVGRKTANVFLNVFLRQDTIPVDTHVSRLSYRIGLSESRDPLLVEKNLLFLSSGKKYRREIHKIFITHGRETCHSRKPRCSLCSIKNLCSYNQDTRENNI